jgi:hypothetical protein
LKKLRESRYSAIHEPFEAAAAHLRERLRRPKEPT